jgi:hypothetical protein
MTHEQHNNNPDMTALQTTLGHGDKKYERIETVTSKTRKQARPLEEDSVKIFS